MLSRLPRDPDKRVSQRVPDFRMVARTCSHSPITHHRPPEDLSRRRLRPRLVMLDRPRRCARDASTIFLPISALPQVPTTQRPQLLAELLPSPLKPTQMLTPASWRYGGDRRDRQWQSDVSPLMHHVLPAMWSWLSIRNGSIRSACAGRRFECLRAWIQRGVASSQGNRRLQAPSVHNVDRHVLERPGCEQRWDQDLDRPTTRHQRTIRPTSAHSTNASLK